MYGLFRCVGDSEEFKLDEFHEQDKRIKLVQNKLIKEVTSEDLSYNGFLDKGDKYNIIECFKNYIGHVLGDGVIYNTPSVSFQLAVTIALSNHKVIDDILQDDSINPDNFPANLLVEKQILAGKKIIDLGCGQPFYAKAAKALGADVHVADINSEHLYSYDKLGLKSIKVDFTGEYVSDFLLEQTGGDFDLVTSAMVLTVIDNPHNIKEPSKDRLKDIALALVKKPDGFYFAR